MRACCMHVDVSAVILLSVDEKPVHEAQGVSKIKGVNDAVQIRLHTLHSRGSLAHQVVPSGVKTQGGLRMATQLEI